MGKGYDNDLFILKKYPRKNKCPRNTQVIYEIPKAYGKHWIVSKTQQYQRNNGYGNDRFISRTQQEEIPKAYGKKGVVSKTQQYKTIKLYGND